MRSVRSRSLRQLTLMGLASIAFLMGLSAQEEKPAPKTEESPPLPKTPQGKPLKLDISRRSLKNFLTDEVALIPHQIKEGEARELQDIFMVGAVKSSHAAFWDPLSCRLLGALNLKHSDKPETGSEDEGTTSSPYTLLAAGAHPLNGSKGAFENPKYFGFRIISGKPEFLYTFGGLQIEERVWLEDDGLVLKERFVVKGSKSGYTLTFPEAWKERCDASIGEWKDNRLIVPGDAADALLLTFHLDERKTSSPPEN